MAFEMKFCSSRRSSERSDCAGSEQETKVNSSPLARASGANSISSERIRSAILKLVIEVVIAPASSREISRSAPRISSKRPGCPAGRRWGGLPTLFSRNPGEIMFTVMPLGIKSCA